MAQQKKSKPAKLTQQERSRPAVKGEKSGDSPEGAYLPGDLLHVTTGGSDDPAVQRHAAQLKDPRLRSKQRQQIISRIGAVRGNIFTQRVIARYRQEPGLYKPSVSAIHQPHVVQLSPLSQEVENLWDRNNKGPFFDRLRRLSAQERGDADLIRFINTSPELGGDDRWLAQGILRYGPEPLWPASDPSGYSLEERHRRSSQHGWAQEPGNIQATLTATNAQGSAAVEAYYFPGQIADRALIIGGMHGSELSAVAVAEELLANLRAGRGPRPYFTLIVVPRLFDANIERAAKAAARDRSTLSGSNIGRYTVQSPPSTDPNRQFPQAGQAFDPNNPVDARSRAIELPNVVLLELIQRYRPSRVANLHSIHTVSKAGIYADPRTDAQGRACGFDQDRDLALAMSERARAGGASAPGNLRRGSRDVRAVYPRDPAAVAAGQTQPRSPGGSHEYQRGTSFGTWGTTAVEDPSNPQHNRPAMTVITVEVARAHRPEDVTAGRRAAREAEISAHAAALQEIFLGQPGTGTRPAQPPQCPAPPATTTATPTSPSTSPGP